MTEFSMAGDNIMSQVTEKINEISVKIDDEINRSVKSLSNGKVPAGAACIDYVRSIREKVLIYYQPIKTVIYKLVSEAVAKEYRTYGLHDLQSLEEKINELKAEKEKTLKEKEQIEEYDRKLPEYKKFLLYEKQNAGKKNNDNNENEYKTNSVEIAQTYQKYVLKRNRSFLIGIFATIACTCVDFAIIYSVFLNSNLNVGLARFTAIVSAAVLDIPPYVFGILQSKKDDNKRLWILRKETDDPGETIELKRYNAASRVLLMAIILILIAYLTLRFLLFLGGGDFDLALHSLIERNFTFENVEFMSSDVLATLVPLGTSAIAFALGILLSSSYTDYIKKTIVIIEKDLQLRVKAYEEKIIVCDEKRKSLESDRDTLKFEIWTFCAGKGSVPEDMDSFRRQVTSTFQQLNLQQYCRVYEMNCTLLRNKAEEMLAHVNSILMMYVSNQGEITSMKISEKEKDILDYFWVIEDSKVQQKATAEHIRGIEELVKRLEQETRMLW